MSILPATLSEVPGRFRRFKMNYAIRVILAFSMLSLACASCQKKRGQPRQKSFLTVQEPEKISDLILPAVAMTSKGLLVMTLFIHSTFPSATEARDAIAVFQSKDKGATWQRIATIPSFVTYGVWGYDLAIDERDNLFLTWVASVYRIDTRMSFKAIMFSRSNDGGKTWTEPVYVNELREGQRRKPKVAVLGDNVYLAWLDQPRGGVPSSGTVQDVYFAASSDGGANWSKNKCLEKDLDKKDSGSSAPSLCVGSDGTVYCAYFSMRKYEKKKAGFWMAKSGGAGGTFSIQLQNVGPLGEVCIRERNGKLRVAVVFLRGIRSISMRSPKTFQEIRLYTSADGGKKWRGPFIIDDDQTHQHKNNVQIIPAAAEKLLAAWDDDRGGVYMACSTNAGKDWGKNIKVAESSHVGITPLAIAVDESTNTFYLILSDVLKGGGDATYLVKGKFEP